MESEIERLKEEVENLKRQCSELETCREERRSVMNVALIATERINVLERENEALLVKAEKDRQTMAREKRALQAKAAEDRQTILRLQTTNDEQQRSIEQKEGLIQEERGKKRAYGKEMRGFFSDLIESERRYEELKTENDLFYHEKKEVGRELSEVAKDLQYEKVKRKTLEKILTEEKVSHTKLKDSSLCILHCGNVRSVTFQPCGHSLFCTECVDSGKTLTYECYYCDDKIMGMVRATHPIMPF